MHTDGAGFHPRRRRRRGGGGAIAFRIDQRDREDVSDTTAGHTGEIKKKTKTKTKTEKTTAIVGKKHPGAK